MARCATTFLCSGKTIVATPSACTCVSLSRPSRSQGWPSNTSAEPSDGHNWWEYDIAMLRLPNQSRRAIKESAPEEYRESPSKTKSIPKGIIQCIHKAVSSQIQLNCCHKLNRAMR